MTRKLKPELIVECKNCGMPCGGSFFDPVNLEKICINCWYTLKCETKTP